MATKTDFDDNNHIINSSTFEILNSKQIKIMALKTVSPYF